MRVHLIGDSLVQKTVAEQGTFYSTWGTQLTKFLSDDVELINYAIGGRSSRSFMNEGRFYDTGVFDINSFPYGVGAALPRIKKGDYVIIQFATNDNDAASNFYCPNKCVPLGTPDKNGVYPTVIPTGDMLASTDYRPDNYPKCLYDDGIDAKTAQEIVSTVDDLISQCGEYYYPYDCGATYKGYLKVYIDMVREKGAIPILVLSPVLHRFTDGKLKSVPNLYGGSDEFNDFKYIEACRQLGREEGVDIIDLFTPTFKIYEDLGEELSGYFHNISLSEGDIESIDATTHKRDDEEELDWISNYDIRRADGSFLELDHVHANYFGGFMQAAILCEELLKQHILEKYILNIPKTQASVPKKLIPYLDYLQSGLSFVTIKQALIIGD